MPRSGSRSRPRSAPGSIWRCWSGFRRAGTSWSSIQRLRRSSAKFAIAGVILGGALLLCERPVSALFAGWTSLRNEMTLLVLAAVGAIIYGIAIRVLFSREWRDLIQGR